jgi:Ca2+-transporting ATPase
LIYVLIGLFLAQMATLYVPAFNAIFHTQPLTPGKLVACLSLSSVVFWGVDVERWRVRSGWHYGNGKQED